MSAELEDVFMGLTTVEQFDAKLQQYSTQNSLQRSLSIMQPHTKIKPYFKTNSMNASQMSTAINSTLSKSRKPTFYRDETMQSPKRRKSVYVNEQQQLNHFSEKILYLASQCANNNDQSKAECHRIAQEFSVSTILLQQLSSTQEREDYIIKAIERQVLDSVKQWKIKIDQRELQKLKVNIPVSDNPDTQNLDIFDWINIHTKFRQLKKKLKFALVEIINDKNNQQYLYQQIQLQPKYKLTDIQYTKPDTRAIIDELTNLLKTIKTKGNQQYNSQTQSKSKQKQLKIDEWTSEKEQQFVDKRQQAKFRLGKLISSSSFNSVAMGEFTSTFDKGQQNKLQRDQLLMKFENCEAMDDDELLYLVNTSVLMNKCSDKKFIQAAINHLDQDIISDIELQIAENILQTFNRIQKELNRTRHEYLKEKNEIQFQKNKSAKVFIDDHQKQKNIRSLQIKILKMLRDMRKQNQSTLKVNSEKYEIYREEFKKGNPIANPMVWKFKDIMMKVIQRNKLQKNNDKLLTKNDNDKPFYKSQSEIITLNMIRRKHHPSSKIVVKIDNDEQKQRVTSQKELSSYKLNIYKKEHESHQPNFRLFYSGGPMQQRPYATTYLNLKKEEENINLPYKGQWITPEIEVVAINKIKRAIKAYLYRKKLMKIQQEKKLKRMQEQEGKGQQFFQMINKMRNKPKIAIDVESCYKSLKLAISQKTGAAKQNLKPMKTIDYSKIKIPKKMIQLKLKQRKLFLALKVQNIQWCEHSGFIFDEYDVNCYDIDMYCPLYHAAKLQSISFCQFLIQNGADVNMPCKNDQTPTFAAFASNNIELINMFIDANANLDLTDIYGKNPLCYCAVNLLKSLNLQGCPISLGKSKSNINQLINQRSQSLIELDYSPYANMHMDPILDPNEEISWCNQQEASLKTFYPQEQREKLRQIREQQMVERMINKKKMQNKRQSSKQPSERKDYDE